MTFCSAGQSGPWGPLPMAPRGCALRVSVSPPALPILLRPKSRATTAKIRARPCSGRTGEGSELAGLNTEQPKRCEPALLIGQIEDHAFVGGHRKPGVVGHL